MSDKIVLFCTNRFDNNKGLHRNSADCDRKNIHFAVDRNIVIVGPDLQAEYPEIDSVYVIAFQILSHLPKILYVVGYYYFVVFDEEEKNEIRINKSK